MDVRPVFCRVKFIHEIIAGIDRLVRAPIWHDGTIFDSVDCLWTVIFPARLEFRLVEKDCELRGPADPFQNSPIGPGTPTIGLGEILCLSDRSIDVGAHKDSHDYHVLGLSSGSQGADSDRPSSNHRHRWSYRNRRPNRAHHC